MRKDKVAGGREKEGKSSEIEDMPLAWFESISDEVTEEGEGKNERKGDEGA